MRLKSGASLKGTKILSERASVIEGGPHKMIRQSRELEKTFPGVELARVSYMFEHFILGRSCFD